LQCGWIDEGGSGDVVAWCISGRRRRKKYRGENEKKCEELCPLAELRSSLIKLFQSLMHGANPWRGKKRMNKFRR